MGKSRSGRRGNHGNRYPLYAADIDDGWRVIRKVSGVQGEEMLTRGLWRDVYDEHRNHVGYQMLAGQHCERNVFPSSYGSSVCISNRDIERNAGAAAFKGSRSKTAGMSEAERAKRINRKTGDPLPPEDATERAIEKVRLWPFPASVVTCRGEVVTDAKGKPLFGDRAVRVYPHVPRKRS
jgi:hypothetical protein